MEDLVKPPFDKPKPLFQLFGNGDDLMALKACIDQLNANALEPAA